MIRELNLFLGIGLIALILSTFSLVFLLSKTDKVNIDVDGFYQDEYLIAKGELTQLKSDYKVLENSKKAICEYNQPTINYFSGIIGLVFGFLGALWFLIIIMKQNIRGLKK